MSKPPSRFPRSKAGRAAPLAAAALLGTVMAPAAAHAPPERVALQARVDAVRAALAAVADVAAADAPATAWLLAQANNWTNWPKWSKWSNWANK